MTAFPCLSTPRAAGQEFWALMTGLSPTLVSGGAGAGGAWVCLVWPAAQPALGEHVGEEANGAEHMHPPDLVDEIEDTAFMSSTDIMENIDVENIYENSSSKFKNKFEKITGINISDMEEDENLHDHIISKLSSELRSQIIKLMDDDPNFHPLKNFKEYQKKLLDLVLVNYVKEDKE